MFEAPELEHAPARKRPFTQSDQSGVVCWRKKRNALLIQASVTSNSVARGTSVPTPMAHTTLTAAPSSSTLQRHPAAAPCSGTLQRHQHARSKAHTHSDNSTVKQYLQRDLTASPYARSQRQTCYCNSSTWSQNPNSLAIWEKNGKCWQVCKRGCKPKSGRWGLGRRVCFLPSFRPSF